MLENLVKYLMTLLFFYCYYWKQSCEEFFLALFQFFFLPQNLCHNSCLPIHICYQFELITHSATHQIVLVPSYHTYPFISLTTQHPGLRSCNLPLPLPPPPHTHTNKRLHQSQEKWWWGLELSFRLLHPPFSQTVLTLWENKSTMSDFCFRGSVS